MAAFKSMRQLTAEITVYLSLRASLGKRAEAVFPLRADIGEAPASHADVIRARLSGALVGRRMLSHHYPSGRGRLQVSLKVSLDSSASFRLSEMLYCHLIFTPKGLGLPFK